MYMFNMNLYYNRPIIVPIVDQTCTFQCLIPMGDLSKDTISVVMNRLVGFGLYGIYQVQSLCAPDSIMAH